MDPLHGVNVEIVSNGRALDLYDDPDASEIQDGYSRHHYVEAVADSTFQIKVELTPEFNLHRLGPGHAVLMQVQIDSNPGGDIFLNVRQLQKSLYRGRNDGHTFEGHEYFCNVAKRWMLSDYSFGNLVLNENSDPGFSVEQAQALGRLQVIVKRVKLKKPTTLDIADTTPIATISEVPEKALKGRAIDTTVRLTNIRPNSIEYEMMDCENIRGEAGKPLVFNIYYRSRRALQIMGILPRSPSPERPTHNADAVQKELQDLRARLALLERGHSVKPESSNAATRNLKRERDDGEQKDGPRQRVKVEHVDLTDERPRRRSPVKVEHVDLTDD